MTPTAQMTVLLAKKRALSSTLLLQVSFLTHFFTKSMCTFWLIEALTRAGAHGNSRMLLDAQMMFEQMLSYSNHLRLFSEQMSFSGVALGNFPQAFTHLALISAAYNLNRYLAKK